MGKMILVTGGARSGKSAFAEQLARESGGSVAYIATAEVWDEEMAHRVTLHRSRRPAGWKTYEAPREAAAVIREAGREHGVILFDCVTIYLSNMLCRETEPYDEAHLTALVRGEMAALVEAAQGLPKEAEVLFVTNEVGAGMLSSAQRNASVCSSAMHTIAETECAFANRSSASTSIFASSASSGFISCSEQAMR